MVGICHDGATNGYCNGNVDSTAEGLTRLNARLRDEPGLTGRLCNALKIGLHREVQVPFKRRYELMEGDDLQVVSQAFCAAISCGYSELPDKLWEPFARLVLLASYRATLQAAVRNNLSKRVFLTFIGGGVFRNRTDWITDAIVAAIKEAQYSDLDIYIVHYGSVNTDIERIINSSIA